MTSPFFNKQVLITGGAGFIGSHLADALLEAGAKVIGVDNFLTGSEHNIAHLANNPNWQFIKADANQQPATYLPANFFSQASSLDSNFGVNNNGRIAGNTSTDATANADLPIANNNASTISSPLAKTNLDYVFHFASPASPPIYQAHPRETYLVNSLATDLLLNFLKQHHPQAKFIFASTSEIYGDPLVHPQPETYWGNVNPNGIRSCYDEAKRLGEAICGVYERDFGMDVRIVRIFNTYGERMDALDGRVIPNFIMQAIENQPITIHGDGLQTRSYCYVADLVAGILALASLIDGKGLTVNLGNPEEYTILETAKLVYEQVKVLASGEDIVDATNSVASTDFADHANFTSFTSSTSASASNSSSLPTNFEKQLIFKPMPGDDPTRRKPDISLAKKLLSWEPKISFGHGLRRTINYFKNTARAKHD